MAGHIGEKIQNFEILAESTREPNGYLRYYWVRCSCGNVKRYRYDQIKKKGSCGDCEDYKRSLGSINGNAKEK